MNKNFIEYLLRHPEEYKFTGFTHNDVPGLQITWFSIKLTRGNYIIQGRSDNNAPWRGTITFVPAYDNEGDETGHLSILEFKLDNEILNLIRQLNINY